MHAADREEQAQEKAKERAKDGKAKAKAGLKAKAKASGQDWVEQHLKFSGDKLKVSWGQPAVLIFKSMNGF